MNEFSCRSACYLLAVFMLATALTACSITPETPSPIITATAQPTESPPDVEVVFQVSIPSETGAEGDVYLEIFNDPAGSGFDVQCHLFDTVDGDTHQLTLSLLQGTLLQYRYLLDTGQELRVEHTLAGAPVTYRRYFAKIPGEVHDIVTSWSDRPSDAPAGQLIGSVTDPYDNPLPDMLITAGGLCTFTGADGYFQLQGLPAGLHNLVVSSIHGTTLPFQQGAVIEGDSITEAQVVVRRTQTAKITFLLEEPGISVQNATIRLTGNLCETGNNFSGLYRPNSGNFNRTTELIRLDDGRYVITLILPVGFDFRYQYTMGDAFINTELDANGESATHQLIIPDSNVTITDRVSAWSSDGNQPVHFSVTVPDETPLTDTVSIQFDLDGWSSPLPMQRVEDHTWSFTLYHPLPEQKQLTYRYCRNLLCTAAPALEVNNGPAEQTIRLVDNGEMQIQDVIQSWAWLPPTGEQTSIIGSPVQPRGSAFMAGVELQTLQKEGSSEMSSAAFDNISSIGANWVVLTPSWRFTRVNPPRLEMAVGEDLFAADVEDAIQKARDYGLQIAMFPRILLDDETGAWWAGASRDGVWWDAWFSQIRAFYRNFAWLAQENGIPVLIFGDPSIAPAYPDGILPSGISSDVFSDAEERWVSIVKEMRTLYQGQVMFAADDVARASFSPEFFQMFDSLYFLVDTPLTAGNLVNQDLNDSVRTYLDTQIFPFSETVQRDVILALNYPSHPDAVKGFIETEHGCIGFDSLAASDQETRKVFGSGTSEEPMPDFTIQYKIYESFLRAVNENEQIAGLVSRGYYVPVERHDFSTSIRGKPAAALLWYWFPRFVYSEPQ